MIGWVLKILFCATFVLERNLGQCREREREREREITVLEFFFFFGTYKLASRKTTDTNAECSWYMVPLKLQQTELDFFSTRNKSLIRSTKLAWRATFNVQLQTISKCPPGSVKMKECKLMEMFRSILRMHHACNIITIWNFLVMKFNGEAKLRSYSVVEAFLFLFPGTTGNLA